MKTRGESKEMHVEWGKENGGRHSEEVKTLIWKGSRRANSDVCMVLYQLKVARWTRMKDRKDRCVRADGIDKRAERKKSREQKGRRESSLRAQYTWTSSLPQVVRAPQQLPRRYARD